MSRRVITVGAIAFGCIAIIAMTMFSRRAELFVGRAVDESQVEDRAHMVNPELLGSGPLVDVSGRDATGIPLPPRTIALTFDDGPDPDWTPRIARALERHGAVGTFYVIGQEALRAPGLVADLAEAGHEIGNHSYTHPLMGTLTGDQVSRQIDLTQRVVAGITDTAPTSFRPPYSGSGDFLPPDELAAARLAADRGMILALSSQAVKDFDSRYDVDDLLAQALPSLGTSSVVTLHDGGGDRSRTVELIDRMVPMLQAQGYRFVTVSEMADTAVGVPLSDHEKLFGNTLVTGNSLLQRAESFVLAASLVVLALTLLRTVVLMWLAHRSEVKRRRAAQQTRPRRVRRAVSVIVPAYNEEDVIEATVRSILASRHRRVEVIVVDDGSTDRTAELLDTPEFAKVRVIRQENRGKARALDTGVRAARHSVVVLVDGDTILEPTTLTEMIRPFSDPQVGAVAGNAKVGNRSGLLGSLQHVEYCVASAVERRATAHLGVMLCVPGAAGAFRRSAVLDVGGVDGSTLAEDTDLTLAVMRAGWKVEFAPDARAWTEAPSTLRGLYRQRLRWNYGILQSIYKHRGSLMESGQAGRAGRLLIPYVLTMGFFASLLAPAVDLMIVAQLLTGHLDPITLGMWLTITLSTTAMGWYALRLDHERSMWALLLPLQQVIYRQLLYATVLRAAVAALSGARLHWNKLPRTADVEVDLSVAGIWNDTPTSAGTSTAADPDEPDRVVIDLRDPDDQPSRVPSRRRRDTPSAPAHAPDKEPAAAAKKPATTGAAAAAAIVSLGELA